jgi:hypothetical protein
MPNLVFILIIGLLPIAAGAVQLGVGVGLSDGHDHAAMQQDFAQLKQDIRATVMLERQLDRLGRQDMQQDLSEAEKAEWLQQSEWLLRQAREVAGLADELEEYQQEFMRGSPSLELFDYQGVKFKSRNRLDAIEDAAEKYTVQGKQAAERQKNAVKAIAVTF